MLAASTPPKFPIPFAAAAGPSFIRPIPEASQIGVQGGAASLTDGFPPDTFQPIASGGVPPFGEDFNGLLNQVTLWNQWQAAGGPITYDPTFATAISGYPQGAILQSSVTIGLLWLNLVDGNTSNPDSGGTNWTSLGTLTTGAVQFRPTSETLAGWVPANGATIGNPSSGATQLALATAANLFSWLWMKFSNTLCPVSGGRGASPAADFAANKTIALLDWRGRGFVGSDAMGGGSAGRLTGVPVTSGSLTAPGSIIGENLHALIIAELALHNHANVLIDPSHVHSYVTYTAIHQDGNTAFDAMVAPSTQNTGAAVTGMNITNANTGSGAGHNTVSQSFTGFVYLKL